MAGTAHRHTSTHDTMSAFPIGLPGDYTLLDLELAVSLNDTSGPVDTFSVTFSPGSDFSSSFTIEIIPDNTYEGIEYFVLEIVDIKEPDGFPGNLQVGTRSKVTVTVLDTDGEAFRTALVHSSYCRLPPFECMHVCVWCLVSV